MKDLILGLDLGKKTGIAKSYLSLKVALPYKTVFSLNDLITEINTLKPLYLVVGWPLLLSGKEGLQCHRVRSMIGNLLYNTYKMDIYFQDERFSTKEVSGSKDEDASSAALILQNYLDALS